MPSPTYKVTGAQKSLNLMPNFTEEQADCVVTAVVQSVCAVQKKEADKGERKFTTYASFGMKEL